MWYNYYMLQLNNHNIILPKYLAFVKKSPCEFFRKKESSPKPARIPPQTPPAGGKSAEAGRIHSPRQIVSPCRVRLVFLIIWILLEKLSNFVQQTPHSKKRGAARYFFFCYAEGEGFEPSVPFDTHAFQACALDRYANPPSHFSAKSNPLIRQRQAR